MIATQNIKIKASKGLVWNISAQIITYLIEIGVKIVLARILLPSDFGIVALALVLINFANLINGFGIGAALVQKKKNFFINAEKTAFAVSFFSGILFYLIIAGLSFPFAYFFHMPALSIIINTLGIMLLLFPLKIVPLSWLTLQFRFSSIAITEILSQLTFGFVSIVLATAGFNYWSLIIGYLSSGMVYVSVIHIISGRVVSFRIKKRYLKELLNFGKYVSGAGIVSFFLLQGDKFLIAKTLGMTALGLYALASSIPDLILSKTAHAIALIALPVYSNLHDYKSRQEAFIKINALLLFFVIPFIAILFLFGEGIILYLLGPQWVLAVLPMQILGVHGLLRVLHINCSTFLTAIGKPDQNQKFINYEFILFCILIYPGISYGGIVGAAIVLMLTRLVGFLITLKYTLKKLQISGLFFSKQFIRIFLVGVITACFFAGLKIFASDLSFPVLVLNIIFFGLIYFFLLGILDVNFVGYFKEFIKLIFKPN